MTSQSDTEGSHEDRGRSGNWYEKFRTSVPNSSRAGDRVDYDLDLPGADRECPWRDKELLEELYLEQDLSQNQIRKGWGCSIATIGTWIEKHDIPKRSRSEAAKNSWGNPPGYPFRTMKNGWEVWQTESREYGVHRLLAVAEFGPDAVAGNTVHHKNGIPWDNRPENLEVLPNSEHQSRHRKVDGVDRIRVAELYENGDLSSRKLAAELECDISSGTVLHIHKEFFGGEAA